MKKLMVFAAVAVCAVMAHAAQFEWSLSQVRNGWVDGNSKIDGTAYLFLVGANGVTESGIASTISGASDATALASTLSGKAIDTAALSTGALGDTTGEVSATAPADLFVVVISDDGHVYQSAAQTVTDIKALGPTTVAFGSQKNATNTSGAWTNKGGSTPPLPEPTSGILMLVGLGALALRRRKA